MMQPPPPHPERPELILVVDDDARYLDLIRHRLRAAGFRVALALDAEQGLARARTEPRPDAVLLDVLLPRTDGFAVCRELRADPATVDLPVLLMSAVYLRELDRTAGLRSGADEYLVKPDAVLAKPLRFDRLLRHLDFLFGREAAPPDETDRETLLVVDDDPKIRRMLRLTLERESYRIVEAAGVEEALEQLERVETDLILSDFQMPDRDGLDLLRQVRERHPTVPVVLMTAHGSEEIAVEAMKLGASDYLVKPLRTQDVAAVLRENLARNRQTVEQRRLQERLQETSRDLMDRVEALERQNAELERSQTELRKARRMQADFIGSISHELRTPLTVIKGALSMVLDAPERLTEERRIDLLRRARLQTDRVVGLLHEHLDLERIEAGDSRFVPRQIDIVRVARDTCRGLQPAAASRASRLSFTSQLDSAPCEADPEAVSRILTHLVHNALEHSPQGSPVEVRVTTDPVAGWRLWVNDRGPGIPAPIRERVFERFARRAEVAGPPATGLGLAIVRSLVELHHGQVGIEDRRGGGSSFYFVLPPQQAPESPPPPTLVAAVGLDPGLAGKLGGALGDLGIDLRLYTDVTSFLSEARREEPGGLVVDLGSSDTSRRLFRLLESLRRNGRPPTCLLSSTEAAEGGTEAARLFDFVRLFEARPAAAKIAAAFVPRS